MSQGMTRTAGGAPADASYIMRVANANTTNETDLSALASGYLKVTTGTGVLSSQATPIPIADGGTNQTSFTTNGVAFFNGTSLTSTAAGTTGQVLHANTGSAPTFSAVSLTADVTGVLPIANGGTNQSSAFTAGSVIFSNGTSLTQDNANFFWDDTANELYIGGTTAAGADIVLGADGHAVFNEQGNAVNFTVQGSTATALFVVDGTNNRVDIGTTVQGRIAKFGSTEIVFNDDAQNQDFRVESQSTSSRFFVDASTDRIGMGTLSPHSTLDLRGGLSLGTTSTSITYTALATDFAIFGTNTGSDIDIDLPDASTCGGRLYFIKKTGAVAADDVVIDPSGAQTIDGAASATLTLQHQWRLIQSDGVSNWNVLASG